MPEPSVPDAAQPCPMCGRPVTVYTGDEGTSSYTPVPDAASRSVASLLAVVADSETPEARDEAWDEILGRVASLQAEREITYEERLDYERRVLAASEEKLALQAERDRERKARKAAEELNADQAVRTRTNLEAQIESERAGRVAAERETEKLREALEGVAHLVRYEYRLKDHDAGFVLNTIGQVLDDCGALRAAVTDKGDEG